MDVLDEIFTCTAAQRYTKSVRYKCLNVDFHLTNAIHITNIDTEKNEYQKAKSKR